MKRTLRATFGGLPRTFWYLWAGMLVNRVGGFVVPFLAIYLTSTRHLSVVLAGQIVALYGAGSLAAGLLGGYLADSVGRKPTLVGAMLSGGAAMLLLGFAGPLWLVALATFLVGFFTDLGRPAINAMIADVVPARDRPRAYSLIYWAANLGFSIAPVIAGALATRSYLALFIGDAATTIAFGALVALRVPETRPTEAAARGISALRGVGVPLKDGVFLSFVGLTFLLAMIFFQFEVALPVDMLDHGISPAVYGSIIAINGVLIVLFQPFAARWIERFRRGNVLASAALLTGVGFALPSLSATPAVYAVGIAVWTMGEILHSPLPPSVVADLSPVSLRGSYQGALHLAWGGAFFLAPALGSVVVGRYGTRALWVGCLALGLCIAAGHLAIAGPRRRRLEVLRLEGPVGQVGALQD